MTDVTDDDVRAYMTKRANEDQRTAYLALGRLLTRAQRAELPTLHWTVLHTRVIRGKVAAYDVRGDRHTRESAMALYERWKKFLGAADESNTEHYMTLPTVTYHARSKGADWLRGHEVLLEVEVDRES